MNVLVIGAHPFDIFFLCGGTLAKFALAGHYVAMLTTCRADTRHPEYTKEIEAARTRDYRNAAAVIGADTYDLATPQFHLRDDYETRLKVTEIIRRVQPKLILTHDADDYTDELRTTSQLAMESMFMSKQRGLKTESPPLLDHPDTAFMDTLAGVGFIPYQFVDITPVMDTKRRMISAFIREVEAFKEDPVVETMELVEVTARYRGIQSGFRYAEGFRWPQRWGFSIGEPFLI